jgi:UrcA family protein
MRLPSTTRSIRHATVAVLAVSVLMIAPMASASVKHAPKGQDALFQSRQEVVAIDEAEMIYTRLRTASRNICGSSNLQVTGSLRSATANADCFEGTLDAAVKRLGNPEVTALHREQSS